MLNAFYIVVNHDSMKTHRKALKQIHQIKAMHPDGSFEMVETYQPKGASVDHKAYEMQTIGVAGFVKNLDQPIDINDCIALAKQRKY